MKSSRYYQNWPQLISRSGEATMFICGILLGKEHYTASAIVFFIRMFIGCTTSEIMYRRMKAVTREEVQQNK